MIIYCFSFLYVCVSLVSFSGSSFDLVNFLFTWALQKGRKVGGTAEHSSIHKCGSIFWCFVLVFVIAEVRHHHHELGHEFCAHKPAQQGPKRIALCPIKLDSLVWTKINTNLYKFNINLETNLCKNDITLWVWHTIVSITYHHKFDITS